jgi:molybdenum cofactor cytidylyltransferase
MAERQIGAIVLAAGVASRFGSDKLLAVYNNRPLIQCALGAAAWSAADPLVVALDVYRLLMCAIDRPIQMVVADTLLTYSLTTGLREIPHRIDGVIVLLADMPMVDGRLVNALIKAFASTDYAVVPEHTMVLRVIRFY